MTAKKNGTRLRGKKPTERKPRLKLLMDGPAGVGKTTALCQMPRPYIIDTEGGCLHYGEMIERVGGAVFETDDMEEALAEIKALAEEEHPFLTLAIDPFTTLWDSEIELGETAIDKEGAKSGFDSGYQRAKAPAKRLLRLIANLDMNVVFTAHQKVKYTTKKGKNRNGKATTELVAEGTTYDGFNKLDYAFDLWVSLSKGKDGSRVADVRKTRLREFPDGDKFAWSYDELVKRYGAEKMERKVESIQFAESDQVEAFRSLYAKLPPALQAKVDKNMKDVDGDPAFLPRERIKRAIEGMQAKVQQTEQQEGVPF